MDQSGPRHPPLISPLVERPDLQSPRQRTLYGAVTVVFWALWVYLWVPVLALLAWALGVEQAYKYMVVLGGYVDVIRLVGIYALVILALGGGLILWAAYNILRFRGVENRTHALPVTAVEIGQYFGTDPALVARWQEEKRLYVSHDPEGRVSDVVALADGAPVPA
jgi:biofilm PGA synthesis protein PgaD